MKTLLLRLIVGAMLLVANAITFSPTVHAAARVQFEAASFVVVETDGEIVLPITWSHNPFPDVSVRVIITGGTAVSGEDFLPYNPIEARTHGGAVWVGKLIDDGIPEGDETITLELVDPSPGAGIGQLSKATVTIRNGKPTVIVARDFVFGDSYPVFIPEGPNAQIEVSRKGDRHEAASVDVEFLAGGGFPVGDPAVAGTDFAPGIHRIEFAPGEVSRLLPAPWQDNPRVDALHKVLAVRLTSHTPGVAVNPAEPLTLVLVDNERATHLDVAYVEPLPPLALFSRVEGGEEFFVNATILPLPDSRKLAFGSSWGMFNRVNGVPRPGLVRLLANDDVDEGFVPDVVGVADGVTLLRSGHLILWDSGREQIIRMKPDGSRDETFRSPQGVNYVHLAEAQDGSLWAATGEGFPLLHLSADGSKIKEVETAIPPRCEECPEWTLMSVLPDGRLIYRSSRGGSFLQAFHADGRPDTALPVLTLEKAHNGGFSVDAAPGEAGSFFVGKLAGVNGVFFECPKRHRVRFTDLPATALQISAKPSAPQRFYSGFDEIESTPGEPKSFSLVFQRLGSSAAPATVHYTTPDVTATAGQDYFAQSGTITFAPLETGKVIQIPILADTEDEFSEVFEVVVTEAEGFEALPAPARFTIVRGTCGDMPRAHGLDRVKRLRDGRVLLGGVRSLLCFDTKVEYSPDLNTWHPLTNLLGGFNGDSAIWLDASATNAATRYYRSVTP